MKRVVEVRIPRKQNTLPQIIRASIPVYSLMARLAQEKRSRWMDINTNQQSLSIIRSLGIKLAYLQLYFSQSIRAFREGTQMTQA